MAVKKQHDADLCDRIRQLEERVRELESRPPSYYVYPYWQPPYYLTPRPWWSTGDTVTTGGTTWTGNTTTALPAGTSITYTSEA